MKLTTMFILALLLTACGPQTEVGLCTDGEDNDHDGDVDCGDTDCATDAACKQAIVSSDTINGVDGNDVSSAIFASGSVSDDFDGDGTVDTFSEIVFFGADVLDDSGICDEFDTGDLFQAQDDIEIALSIAEVLQLDSAGEPSPFATGSSVTGTGTFVDQNGFLVDGSEVTSELFIKRGGSMALDAIGDGTSSITFDFLGTTASATTDVLFVEDFSGVDNGTAFEPTPITGEMSAKYQQALDCPALATFLGF